MTHRTRIAAAVMLVALACLGSAAAARAGDDPAEPGTTTTSTIEGAPAPDIIPEPNRGRPPDDAGDRGGALQTVIFAAIIVGVAGIGALVVRESRRARDRRGF